MPTRRTVTAGLATAFLALPRRTRAQASAGPDPRAGKEVPPVWTVKPHPIRLKPDGTEDAEAWSFSGRLAPVLRVRHGEELRLAVVNESSSPLALHWHGVRGPNAMDGVGGLTQAPIASGESFTYAFTPPDPGTYLVRPCVPGASAEAQGRGLSALLIVEEKDPLPVDRDFSFLVADWRLESDGRLAPFLPPAQESPVGRLGNLLTVNGRPVPARIEAAPGSLLRLRFANACNARSMRLRFEHLNPRVIALDGQPTETFEPFKATLPFAPGSRYDVVVEVPAEAGTRAAVTAMIGDGMPLVTIAASGGRLPSRPAVRRLPANAKLPVAIPLQDAKRRDVTILHAPESPDSPWSLNGGTGDAGKPLLSVRRGTPVVLALANRTPFVQPMHLHGHVFRLLHALDDGWQPYFLDTVQVPENKTSRIAFIADNPGKWLLASTVLDRFDSGLWTWIEVT